MLVVIGILALLVGLVLPMLAASRQRARQMAGTVNARSIEMGMLTFAQNNGGWYPGRDSHGAITSAMVEKRYRMLLEGRHVMAETLISPADPVPRSTWSGGDVHRSQYSFALPVILSLQGIGSERADEFRDTLNSRAVAVTDRAIVNGESGSGGLAIRSIHTAPAPDTSDWAGSVVWNDGHGTFAGSPRIATRYGSWQNDHDHLFASPGETVLNNVIPFSTDTQHDALMSSYGVLVGLPDQ